MSQKFSLYDDLSIADNLDFFAGVYGVPANEREEKKHWVLSFSGLEGKQDQLTGSLPGGWKQRVAFGAAIMHEPGVLFLDEPTSGVDPLARRALWTMINRLADAGTAILVTTHYLEESEQCNRLGLMVAGELIVEGTPSSIKSAADRTSAGVHRRPAAERGGFAQTGHGTVAGFVVWRPPPRHYSTTTQPPASAPPGRSWKQHGIHVIQVREKRFSMEDVFISIVEKARQQGKVARAED